MFVGIWASHMWNRFHSLNPEISISHSNSNTNLTKKLNSILFRFDGVIIIGVDRNTGISHLKQISITQSWDINISFNFNHETTKKLNWTVFGFDVVNIIRVSRNTGISHFKRISFTQSWDINIAFNFIQQNHEKIEFNRFWFWCCKYHRCD